MTDFTAIGRPTPLRDGRAKITGALQFTADLAFPHLLHARLVTSLYPHARLQGIDARAALALPGVAAVLTAADMPAVPTSSRSHLLLARDRVIFTGQPVALVLADSEAAAADGARAVAVSYHPLPAAVSLEEALAEGAPLVWPNGVPSGESVSAGAHGADSGAGEQAAGGKRTNICADETHTRGDIEAGFREADIILAQTFTTPMVHQSSIETQSVIAVPHSLDGGVTLHSSTQAPFDVRHDVAELLGVPDAEVRVIPMAVGGGFGAKFGLYETLAAAAARRLNRPVRLVLTRSEELLATNPAPPTRIRLRLGAKRDGNLTALEAEVAVDNGCFPFDIAGFFAFMLAGFYRLPHLRVRGLDVLTFKPSAGAYRAPGAPCLIFALDSLMDDLARQLDFDPLEFRLLNAVRTGDPMGNGKPWAGIGMRETLEALRAHPAWQNRHVARAAGRGVGISVGGWIGGVEPAAAVCALDRDGSLSIQVGSVDLTGTATGFALMAAEAFGASAERVRVHVSDTLHAPYSGGTGGSKVTYSTGLAVVAAAREARRQTLELAAEMMEASVDDLEIVDGAVQVRGVPGKGIALSEIASRTMRFAGRYAPVYAHGRAAETARAPAFSAQLAEVEVDKDTGEVAVKQLVVVQDVGRAINPLAVRGQMMGGATQGLGWALCEAMTYDDQGQLLSGNLMEYALPTSLRAAPIDTVIVEVPADHGPFGVRGVGEAPVIPTPAAIANAIADATGVRLTHLPMTAPRVLAALADTNGKVS